MPGSRLVFKVTETTSVTTYLFSEHLFQSSWSHPNVPVLVFADSQLPGFSVQHHGGPVGSGLPVELLFWGDWWNSAEGVGRRTLIIDRTQALLASDYFSELKQYGVDRPFWRGAKTVTKPGAPGAFNSNDDQKAVPDLIDDLIDDDVFPDPDDEKIAFVVFMPKGFTQSIGANGAHTKDYNYTFPWDEDWYWVAWVRSFGAETGEDPEDALRTMSHELVEMLSDPEQDAWYASNSQTGEIGDAAVSSPGNIKQTAWVNGVHVQAYWSNQYGATVIPIDRDYQARILGSIKLTNRTVVNGTFRPDPTDSRLCELVPQCCIVDRDYKYTIVKRDELVRLSVETQRYRQPQVAWTVEGIAVTGNGKLSLNVLATTFVGHKSKLVSKTVDLQCTLTKTELTLQTVGTECNFDITVSCAVTDGSITGNVRTNVIAKPSTTVGFVGEELTVDPEYERQMAECAKAAAKMFKGIGQTKPKVKIGDPVEFEPGVLGYVPAYARLNEYARAERAVELAQMAHAVLPQETAKALTVSLISDVPALQAAIAIQASKKRDRDVEGFRTSVENN
jgi:hypothetical protein